MSPVLYAVQPITVHRKGRGAVSSPQGRYDREAREAFDDGWATSQEPACPGPRTQVEHTQARSILSRNSSPDIGFDLSINPYRGCEHGCVYCYARPGHAWLGWSAGLDFETRIIAKTNAASLLHAELTQPGYRCEPLAIGVYTDAWQPAERELGITRACLEVCARLNQPVILITKSSLIERDIDLLAPMAKSGLVSASISITTLDPHLARLMEPRAAAPWRRLQTVERLTQAGIPVDVSLAPVIPFLNEPEIESVLEAAAHAGARHAHAVLLRLPLELREVFTDWLRLHFPDRAERVMGRLRDMRAGRDNDSRFGTRMKGEGVFAQMIRSRVRLKARQLGLQNERPPLRTDLFVRPGEQGSLF